MNTETASTVCIQNGPVTVKTAPEDSRMKFFVPGLECWFDAELVDDEIRFTAVDAEERICDGLDGARIHGSRGTLAFFKSGRANCHHALLKGGFQLRAAGESWEIAFVGRPEHLHRP